ncbi:hypothetical protein BIW11_01258 [Tropilaelaps mercedesae]|uniref:thioredoxin-dependent peroxiredoxin n=1 Tax=Tropilaelaps mercedesae TaxID=418985 RepID=A0A1V9XH13_9ACAR|nr:hypothetical protein BIW11_01258 [Tropilaelaps mercedesae]
MSSEVESVPAEGEILEMGEKVVEGGMQPVVSVVSGQTAGDMEQEWVTAEGNFLSGGQDLIVVTQSPNGNVITQSTYRSSAVAAAALAEVDDTTEVVAVLESAGKKRRLKGSPEEEGVPRLKRWYRQKFCEAWTLDERFKDWIARVSNDPYKAYCRYCKVELRAGSSEFLRHMKTKYHSDVQTQNSRQHHQQQTVSPSKELYCVLEEHNSAQDGTTQMVGQVVQYEGGVQFMEYGESLQQRHEHEMSANAVHDDRSHIATQHQQTQQSSSPPHQQMLHGHQPTIAIAAGQPSPPFDVVLPQRDDWELTKLHIMKPAPAFRGKAFAEGAVKDIRLSDYLGKFVLLTFYTDDFNSNSVNLLQELIAHHSEFTKLGCVLLAASTNSVLTHKAWATSISDNSAKIPIALVADFNKKVSLAFGVYDEESGYAFPSSFLIDTRGYLRHMVVHDLSRTISLDEPLRFLRSILKKPELLKVD